MFASFIKFNNFIIIVKIREKSINSKNVKTVKNIDLSRRNKLYFFKITNFIKFQKL